MRALQLHTWHQEAELVEIEDPTASPGEVIVKVGGAGACHSDVHIMHGPAGPSPFAVPFTLGHENAGWVHEVGDGVRHVEVGQPVAVYGPWGCGTCERCRVNMDNYCEGPRRTNNGMGCGLGMHGGMADYVLVPEERYLVPLPEGLAPALAAPLTDAGLTPYHAIRRSLPKLGPKATAVVIGVGGLGHLAVQILKALCAARIVVVDTKTEALELATTLGAEVTIAAGEGAAAEIRRATGGRGADLVLDFVGVDATLALAASSARSLGDITVVGVAGGTLPFSFIRPAYEVSVQSVYWGSRRELSEVLELAARGLVVPETTNHPLEDAVEVYRALARGEVRGRAVIVPNDAP